jgi:hypothetical protein
MQSPITHNMIDQYSAGNALKSSFLRQITVTSVLYMALSCEVSQCLVLLTTQ